MVGASRNHERLSGNVFVALLAHLKDLRCEPFMYDIKVKADGHFFYPNMLVVCDDEQGDDYYTEKSVIIVDVLSKCTRRNDKSLKIRTYKTLSSLQEYVLIEQDFVDIEVCPSPIFMLASITKT